MKRNINVLFDFVTLQDRFLNGGVEYILTVLDSLLSNENVKIYAAINKNIVIPQRIKKIITDNNLFCIDVTSGLKETIEERKIDRIFIGVAQRWFKYDLNKLNCKIFVVCHDIGDISQLYHGDSTIQKKFIKQNVKRPQFSIKRYIYQLYFDRNRTEATIKAYKPFQNLIKLKNVYLITVSNYSAFALSYYFDDIANPIKVFAGVQKKYKCSDDIANNTLKEIVVSGKKYFLLLNCDRKNKNAALFIEVWNKFCRSTDYQYYALLIGKLNTNLSMKNMFNISELTSSDLENAYKHAFSLVYPSVSEGYGYPPIDAMKYGTPVLASNVTSIPEICKTFVLYFSPFYPEDLYRCMIELIESREKYATCAKKFTLLNTKIQKNDFKKLIEYILC